MRRSGLVAVVALCSTLAATTTASAAPMDFALSNLRLDPQSAGCDRGAGVYCADNTMFERLMLQFGTAMMLPASAPAATLGSRGFYIGIDTTLTTLDSDQAQWQRGTQGDTRTADRLGNSDPSGVLVWNRLQVRKGLPLGLEIDASIAQAAGTDVWLVAGGLKLALVEGFRTGIGRLPDVAVRAGLASTAGGHDASLTVVSVDLLLSKPFVMQQAWTVTPMFALQGAWLMADSDLVDLTPEVDAFAQCNPRPGHQQATAETPGATLGCQGSAADYANTVVFRSVRRFNLRATFGAEVRYRVLVTRASLTYGVLSPDLGRSDTNPDLSRQLTFNLGAGIVF